MTCWGDISCLELFVRNGWWEGIHRIAYRFGIGLEMFHIRKLRSCYVSFRVEQEDQNKRSLLCRKVIKTCFWSGNE